MSKFNYCLISFAVFASMTSAMSNAQTLEKNVNKASEPLASKNLRLAAVDNAPSWAVYTYWKDAQCSEYAGETGVGLNACYPSANIWDGYFVKASYNTDSYTSKGVISPSLTYYTSSTCTTAAGVYGTLNSFKSECSLVPGGAFYQTGAIVNTPTTSFNGNGVAMALWDTNADCNSNVGQMYWSFQVYNSGICQPQTDGAYSIPTSCGNFDVSYGAGSHCDTGSITISTSSGYQTCGTTQNSSTLVGYSGVAEYTCYSSSSPSSEKSSDTLSTGAAVGIAIGGTVLLLVGLFLIAYYGFGLFGGKKSGLNAPLIGN